MIADHGSWSLGVLLGLPAWGILTLAIVAFAAFAFYEREIGLGLLAVAALLVPILGVGLGFYPWHAEYHQWRTVTGTVDDTNSRFLSTSEKSVSQRFVLTIDGRDFGCDDTRCASVKKGDRVTLSCKREWQYAGIDGYGCNFRDRSIA